MPAAANLRCGPSTARGWPVGVALDRRTEVDPVLINPTVIDQVRVANPKEIARAIHADAAGPNRPARHAPSQTARARGAES